MSGSNAEHMPLVLEEAKELCKHLGVKHELWGISIGSSEASLEGQSEEEKPRELSINILFSKPAVKSLVRAEVLKEVQQLAKEILGRELNPSSIFIKIQAPLKEDSKTRPHTRINNRDTTKGTER